MSELATRRFQASEKRPNRLRSGGVQPRMRPNRLPSVKAASVRVRTGYQVPQRSLARVRTGYQAPERHPARVRNGHEVPSARIPKTRANIDAQSSASIEKVALDPVSPQQKTQSARKRQVRCRYASLRKGKSKTAPVATKPAVRYS